MRASEGRTAAVLLELLVLGVLIITSIHTHTECESYSFAYTREANEHGERAKAHTPLARYREMIDAKRLPNIDCVKNP
jgi:hypothetical protein